MTHKPRILIIDDQTGIRKMLSLILETADFEAHVACNGTEGLAKINEIKPDLVLLDVMMPDISGIDVCRRIRSQPATARLPVIMLSANGQTSDKVSGFEVGADDYIVKTVAREELLARINALLLRAQYAMPPQPTARSVAFIGAKGGVGVTTTAINVGIALAANHKSVSLIELQTHLGTASYYLNMDPKRNLGDLLALEIDELSVREVNRRVVQHSSGLRLLNAPPYGETCLLETHHVSTIIEALSQGTDYLLLDVPIVAGEAIRQTLEQVDQILLLTEPEMASVKAARAKLEMLREWGIFDSVQVVMVSRSSSAMLMRREEVEHQLGINKEQPSIMSMQPDIETGSHVIGAISPAPEAFQQASRLGVPVVISKPDILAAKAFQNLANYLLKKVPTKIHGSERLRHS